MTLQAIKPVETTRTIEDREIELAALERELHHASTLKDSIDELSRDLQRQTSRNLEGRATVAAVTAAQQRLDDALAAFGRIPALNRAIASSRDALDWARGQERKAVVDALKSEALRLIDANRELQKQVFAGYREIATINQRIYAMTGHPFVEQNPHSDLHLPLVHGSLRARSNISSGMEIF